MRKKRVILAILLTSAFCYGQDMGDDQVPKNKKGNEILPKKGDFGIGFNAIPVLNVFFDMFNSSGNGADEVVQYANANNQIVGKYFLAPKTALRVRFGVNTLSGAMTNHIQDANAMQKASTGTADDIAAASLITVDDKLTFTKNNVMLSIGIEKRRGYRRLQGIYGVELGFGRMAAREKVAYGNAFSGDRPTYYTNDFNAMTTTTVAPTAPGRNARPLDTKYEGGFRVGVRGFIGIEYFVCAKISVGAEYGWAYSIANRRAATLKQEVYFNGQNGPAVVTEDVETDSHEMLRGFAVDNNNGAAFSMDNTLNGNTVLSGGAGALSLIFHF